MGMVSQKATVSWEEAVEVLTACNLQVEEAFNELQRRRLQPLYEFIFGDYKAFTKNMTEMDFLKELAMKGAKKEGIEYQVKKITFLFLSRSLLFLTEWVCMRTLSRNVSGSVFFCFSVVYFLA